MHPSSADYVSTTRLLPTPLPSLHLPRPRINRLLDEATDHPITVIVAGPGSGKSTALAGWAAERRVCWYACSADDARLPVLLRGVVAALRARVPVLPPELAAAVRGSAGPDADDPGRADALGALLAEALDAGAGGEVFFVVDDVDAVPAGSSGERLLVGLARQAPAALRLLLSSRGSLPLARLSPRGTANEVDGRALAFTIEETNALLTAGGVEAPDLAAAVHRVTGGWPAAVRLALETLRSRDRPDVEAVLSSLHGPGGRLYTLLVEEVLDQEPPDRRDLVRRIAALERVNPELCTHLGLVDARAQLADLERRGLMLDHRDAEGWTALTPVVREAVRAALPLDEDEHRNLARAAAAWLGTRGHAAEAVRLLQHAVDGDALAELLAARGDQLVAAGACQEVVDAASQVPEELRGRDVRLVEGHARQVLGDWVGALDCFAEVAGSDGTLPAGLAWRMGLIHHFRGELDLALATYERGLGVDDADHPVERAHLLAWAATAHWLRGEIEQTRALADEAHAIARAEGDPAALAITHTTLALVAAADGDRRGNDAHYLRALGAAEEAGDVLQLLRIRSNRGSRHLEEGSFSEALTELELALRLAEASGFAAVHALALCNRADAHARLGHLEVAMADYEQARALYQRIDSRFVSYPLRGIGDIHRERGDLALARSAYEEAIEVATSSRDEQGLVPALSGLARVLVDDDPERAARLAEDAVRRAGGLNVVGARLAAGWVALAHEDREAADRHGAEAETAARGRRDRPGIAESLELRTLAAPEPALQLRRLEEAAAIWQSLDVPIGHARAELAAALLDQEGGLPTAARARHRLRYLGVNARAADAAGALRVLHRQEGPAVEIQALGAFAVRRNGEPVPHAEWQSREARDLVKVLVARRGRPTPRARLAELLWPEVESPGSSDRLSRVIQTARAVLAPAGDASSGRFVVADPATVGLDLAHVSIDVEAFLATASEGLELRDGDPAQSRALLAEAEASYTGDVLEEDAHEEWATPLREEARAAYVAVARALADDAIAAGDADRATRYLLRILERDQFDERAHLGLLRALTGDGRHGEARRRYRMYTARMAEVGVDAEPFAAVAET